MTLSKKKIKVGITTGDVNSISIEVIIKSFLDNRIMEFCTPIIFGSSQVISYHRKMLGIKDFSFNSIKRIKDVNPKRVNLFNIWEEDLEINLGTSTSIAGSYALKSLNFAAKALKNKEIDVLITGPINKFNVHNNEKTFIGHTEFLGKQFSGEPLMIMQSENLRIAFVTGHIPVSKISESLSKKLILSKIQQLSISLKQDFCITKPKIAIMGLNPHAGEGGVLGSEEKDIIIPAIKEAEEKNILAFGPYPADSFFIKNNLEKFDGVLAMYHDQGLAPFKSLVFSYGVNYTAGLSIIRTAPVHGTAYNISGKNCANETSFRNAIFLASDIYKNREKTSLLNQEV